MASDVNTNVPWDSTTTHGGTGGGPRVFTVTGVGDPNAKRPPQPYDLDDEGLPEPEKTQLDRDLDVIAGDALADEGEERIKRIRQEMLRMQSMMTPPPTNPGPPYPEADGNWRVTLEWKPPISMWRWTLQERKKTWLREKWTTRAWDFYSGTKAAAAAQARSRKKEMMEDPHNPETFLV
mgnify:CR=1 FL=1